MRTLVFAGESLRSYLSGSSRRCLSLDLYTSSLPVYRRFTTTPRFLNESEDPASSERPHQHRSRRIASSRLSRPTLNSTGILEGGFSESRDGNPTSAQVAEQEEVDERSRAALFYDVLQGGQPETVMNAFLNPAFEDLVGSLPQTVFVEAFHLLSPAYFVEPYREIHRPLHPYMVKLKRFKPLNNIFDEFVNKLATIIKIRQGAGQSLGLAEYTHLLDCARSIGDAVMADSIWHNMHEDEVLPDVRCYNYYMEAKVWDASYTGTEKYHLRMTPYVYRHRSFFNPNRGWRGYGTGRRSVRAEVLQLLTEMMEEGHPGDEATFVNVILASARTGHVDGIKHVLRTIWNVDIDTLEATADESTLPPVTHYDPSSPLHPTDHLLFAVAHAFGTNNNIPTALKAVDFISRSYNLAVPEKVWLELFERSYVLSRPRFGPDAHRNNRGKVSFDFMDTIFQTMTSEPFNVRPTMVVTCQMARIARDRKRINEFVPTMITAYNILKETRRKRNAARLIVEEYLGRPFSWAQKEMKVDPGVLRSRAFADAVNTYDILRLQTAQQTCQFEWLARVLLIQRRWTGRDNPNWERFLLPRALDEWRDFLPQAFFYITRGGRVEFEGQTEWSAQTLPGHGKVPVRRAIDENGDPEPEAEGEQIDDSYLWDRYRRLYPSPELDTAPFNRLFWEIDEKSEAFRTAQSYWGEDIIEEPDAFQRDPDMEASTSNSLEGEEASLHHADDDLPVLVS